MNAGTAAKVSNKGRYLKIKSDELDGSCALLTIKPQATKINDASINSNASYFTKYKNIFYLRN